MESINQFKQQAESIQPNTKTLLAFAILIAGTSLAASGSQAQSFAEWFSQKKTQQKYLVQQVAALHLYSGYLRQGYQIANGGLGYITGTLKDEFNLHEAHYDNLKAINPEVKNNSRVDDILTWQVHILRLLSGLDQVSNLKITEKQYLAKVRQAVLSDCGEQITSLQTLLSKGKLEMSDDERISRLNTIHLAMQSNYRFAGDMTRRVKLYSVQKRKEAANLNFSRQVWGIR